MLLINNHILFSGHFQMLERINRLAVMGSAIEKPFKFSPVELAGKSISSIAEKLATVGAVKPCFFEGLKRYDSILSNL